MIILTAILVLTLIIVQASIPEPSYINYFNSNSEVKHASLDKLDNSTLEYFWSFIEELESTGKMDISPPEKKINNTADYAVLTENETRIIWAAKTAHAIWLDKNNLVPWKLNEYNSEELKTLFNKSYIFDDTMVCNPSCSHYTTFEYIEDYSPSEVYNYSEQFISETREKTYYKIIEDAGTDFRHILSNENPSNSVYESLVTYNGTRRIANGCNGMSRTLVAELRSLNIPAYESIGLQYGHSSAFFEAVDKILVHGDDIYNMNLRNTPTEMITMSYDYFNENVAICNNGNWRSSSCSYNQSRRFYNKTALTFSDEARRVFIQKTQPIKDYFNFKFKETYGVSEPNLTSSELNEMESWITKWVGNSSKNKIKLEKGWNLISVPINLSNYNVFSYENGWKSHIKGNPLNTLDSIEDGKAYFVYFESSEELEFDSREIEYNFSVGWNLLPYLGENKTNLSYLSTRGINYSDIYGYKNDYFIPNELVPGLGYWINIINSTLIENATNASISLRVCPGEYNSIQEAIDDSVSGDKIFICNGTYNEHINISNRNNLTILGESKNKVIVKGTREYSGFWLNSSSNIKISEITILNQSQGIYLENSDNNLIENIYAYNNAFNGIYLENSDFNNITNSNFSMNILGSGIVFDYSDNNFLTNNFIRLNNKSGVYVSYSSSNLMNNNQIADNWDSGIFFYSETERLNNDYSNNYIFANVVCDIWEGISCYHDLTRPATIDDLTAKPGDNTGEVILEWTAVGGNWDYGRADRYELRYSSSSIDETNWDSADIYPQSWVPLDSSQRESKIVSGFPIGNNFWFAIKSIDEDNLESSVSNSENLAPISIDSVTCVKALTNINCNVVPSFSYPSTKYLYDLLEFSANVTNNASNAKTANLNLYGRNVPGSGDGDFLTSKTITIAANSQQQVSGIFWNASIKDVMRNRLKYAQDIFKDYDDMRIWSLKDYGNVTWFSSTTSPAPNGIKSNNSFYVQVKIWNNRQPNIEDFYDIPARVFINPNNFTIKSHSVGSSNTCDSATGDKLCYVDRPWSPTGSQAHYWEINPLSAGNYSVRVALGNLDDQYFIERNITITD